MILFGAMRFMRVAVLMTLGLMLGLASRATVASPAEDRVLARQHFESGSRHFDLSEWDKALAEFKEAYRLTPDATFIYNIAQCHRKLGNIEDALTFYKTYLRRAPNAPNRQEVERRISELEGEQQAKQAKQAEAERVEQVAKAAAAAKAVAEAKAAEAAAVAKPVAPPAAGTRPQTIPSPLPAAAEAPAATAPENRVDLAQSPASAPPAAAPESSILGRWWFWTAIGVVVAGGVAAGLLLTRGSSGTLCPECAATTGVDLK